jgi:hypothetical protein
MRCQRYHVWQEILASGISYFKEGLKKTMEKEFRTSGVSTSIFASLSSHPRRPIDSAAIATAAAALCWKAPSAWFYSVSPSHNFRPK